MFNKLLALFLLFFSMPIFALANIKFCINDSVTTNIDYKIIFIDKMVYTYTLFGNTDCYSHPIDNNVTKLIIFSPDTLHYESNECGVLNPCIIPLQIGDENQKLNLISFFITSSVIYPRYE